MCGISGIFRRTPGAPLPDRDELARIHAALAPRGPDGEGIWTSPDGRLLLAHRRLAILDLSPAGAQPMSSADGRFTLVFNGEIYNFRELAAELAAQGVRLRSRSDTEVILELWRREGPRALAKLRGMFALAIWDDLTVASSSWRATPTASSRSSTRSTAASCASPRRRRALEAGGGLSLEVDPAAVAGLLSWGAVPEPLTPAKVDPRAAGRSLGEGHRRRLVRHRNGPAHRLRIRRPPMPRRRSTRASAPTWSPTSRSGSSSPPASIRPSSRPWPCAAAQQPATAHRPHPDLGRSARHRRRRGAARPRHRRGAGPPPRGARDRRRRSPRADAEDPRGDGPAVDRRLQHLAGGARGEGGGAQGRPLRPRRRRALRRLQLVPRRPPLASARPAPSPPARSRRSLARAGAPPGARDPEARECPALRRELRRRLRPAPRRLPAARGGPDPRTLRPGRTRASGSAPTTPRSTPGRSWAKRCSAIRPTSCAIPGEPSTAWNRRSTSATSSCATATGPAWPTASRSACRWSMPGCGPRWGSSTSSRPGREGKAAVVRAAAPELPQQLFSRPKSGFQLPIADWLENDSRRSRPSRVGAQSRRLALQVLEAFGVSIRAAGDSREVDLRENQQNVGG